jgi:hypothetical protein
MTHYCLIPGIYLHEVTESVVSTTRVRSKVTCHECLFHINGNQRTPAKPVPQPEN